ncbi:MAG: OB-fold domain-containing protein [Myxococcota bacterium]
MTRLLGDDWLLPALDAKNRAWFTSGRLVLQACTQCQAAQFPPEDACRRCGSFELGTRESAGRGRVESAVVVHHPVHPALRDHVPYAVVLVSLDDAPGVRLVGNVLNRAPEAVAIGDAVQVAFEEVSDPGTGDALRIPQWEVVSG